jgi:hypothetical protein
MPGNSAAVMLGYMACMVSFPTLLRVACVHLLQLRLQQASYCLPPNCHALLLLLLLLLPYNDHLLLAE